jgi:hypothetical protein
MPQRRWAWRRGAVACVLAIAALVGVLAMDTTAAAAGEVDYEPPVDARVVDPFRVDGGPYSAGNRGLDYGTGPGTEVRAAADGVVTFAGRVGTTRHVTVLHDDGVRTSYSFLDDIRVVRGQRVRQGQVVGTTLGQLHFGARRGDSYFDPATLFDDRAIVYLVPFDVPPGFGPGSERSALRQLIGGLGRGAKFLARGGGAAVAALGAGATWLAGQSSSYARGMFHYIQRVSMWSYAGSLLAAGRHAWEISRRECTRASAVVPPMRTRHAAVLVGGLGSSSTNAAADDVDTDALGYRPDDVVRYSYNGGRIPPLDGRGATFAALPEHAYGLRDTFGDIFLEGEQFADFIEAIVAEQPGMPIDVIAHSQGGLVSRRGLEVLEDRHGPRWVLDHVNLYATIASPHRGSDVATAAGMANHTNLGNVLLDGAELAVPLDVDSDAIRQLGEHSELIDHFARRPVLQGLNALSIAASSDLAVPVPRSRAEGMRSSVVHIGPTVTAHDQAPGLADTTRELALAIDRRPPGCRGFWEAWRDEATGETISQSVDVLGAIVWTAAMRFGG